MEIVLSPELRPVAEAGGQPLIDLCREEADRFDQSLRQRGVAPWTDGLADWEKSVLVGYLYQKIRGHVL